ncbi:MAG: ABC transporter permease [Bacteroidetes bacterium QS_9_68_14]|nr:MAG: ABC transporter permease [Bacteroidetes bacterium QS_9_68_14]
MGLSVLGVALGVAVVVGIDLANTSADRAFQLSAQRLTGKATHQVVGAGEGLPASAYRRLRTEAGYRASAPVVAEYVQVLGAGRPFQLLGVDPFAEGPFRPYVGGGGAGDSAGVDLGAFMGGEHTALLAAPTARAMGEAPGDTLTVTVDGAPRTLRVAGLIEPRDERARRATRNLLVTDISTAQEVLGMGGPQGGQLTRIDLILPDGEQEEKRAKQRLQQALPPGAQVRRSDARTETVEQMTRAFSLNLSALSLLALVVGLFLIYNTMTFSVVQRRPLLGRLRALGVTRREVFTLVLGEAVLVGAVGTACGLALGMGLAQGLVRLVTRAINDLYFVVNVQEVAVSPWVLAKGAALGMGATLAAAFPPAREAARAKVSVVLQRSRAESAAQKWVPRLAWAGGGVAVLAGALLLAPSQSIWVGYAALFCALLAAALLAPALVVAIARALRPVMEKLFGVLGKMAARGLRQSLSRTGVAIAALMVAVAATVGVGVMTKSFRQTVESWLQYSLQSDVYVQPPSLVFRRSTATLAPGTADTLAGVKGVAGAHTVRRVEVASSAGPTQLVAIAPGPETRDTYRLKSGNAGAVWPRFRGGKKVVIVSEPYSYRTGVGVGDTLRLQTDRGRAGFHVGAVFFDYASDRGVVTMSRATYDRFYDDRRTSGVALHAVEGLSADSLAKRVRTAAPPGQKLVVQSSRGLREASLKIFDRTFAITNVLRLLAVVVAFIGVLSALMALQLERRRELAVMRAGGMTPGQVGGYVTLQTGLMGLTAGLLALPLGMALAYVLIFVINKRSFGWTLQLEASPGILLQAVFLALVAALLAGAYPAWKMARENPAEAMREG